MNGLPSRIVAVSLVASVAAACASEPLAPSVVVQPSATTPATSSGALELPGDTADLAPGRYARADFVPGVSFEVDDVWSSGTVGEGSIAIQSGVDDGEVVVTLAHVDAESAASAAAVAQAIPGISVVASSDSRMSGLTGSNLELENPTAASLDLLTTASGAMVLEPGERVWLSLFDTPNGVLAIAVSSDAASYDAALLAAEPLLESVAIAG